MKITNKDCKDKYFMDISYGVVFRYCNSFYIKTDEVTDNYDGFYNAVDLKTGGHTYIGEETLVQSLDCELVINN